MTTSMHGLEIYLALTSGTGYVGYVGWAPA